MNIHEMTTRQLKAQLKQFSIVSLGIRDIILMQMIEDELARRGKL